MEAADVGANIESGKDPHVLARSMFFGMCRDVSINSRTKLAAWEMYMDVAQKFTLDGDIESWLCVALCVAFRNTYRRAKGLSNILVFKSGISLMNLLRSFNTSIYTFFSNIKKWAEMTKLSKNFLHEMEKLERKFSITIHMYDNYKDIFQLLFVSTSNSANSNFRNPKKCTASKLYEYCWCLYLCMKNRSPNRGADMPRLFFEAHTEIPIDFMSSYELLICCIDFIYMNALAEKRIDLINPDFDGCPENWNTPLFNPQNVDKHCTIGVLCSLKGVDVNHTLAMKEGYFKKLIQQLFASKTIDGSKTTFLGVIGNAKFEFNCAAVDFAYDQYLNSCMFEIDERVLLKARNEVSDGEQMYLQARNESLPVENVTDNMKKLYEIEHITEPTAVIRQADENTMRNMAQILDTAEAIFCANFPYEELANSRFQLAKSLNYFLLEKLILYEIKTKPNIDLSILLNTEVLTMTIVCCLEIVLEASNLNTSRIKFPWILECFGIEAFKFYKIIEPIVRGQQNQFSRGIIKHLNKIEEMCLESLSWAKTSPLWQTLPKELYKWVDVDIENKENRKLGNMQLQAPMDTAVDARRVISVNGNPVSRLGRSNQNTVGAVASEIGATCSSAGPTKSTSFSIFLRKFYRLAWKRMKYLCMGLDLGEDMLNQIWTFFEYSIIYENVLLQDRHLDQLLMCAIYMYIKVRSIPKTFNDIKNAYKTQIQGRSSTYRSVLLNDENDKGDIISFYNQFYVDAMKEYALKFYRDGKNSVALPLPPQPSVKRTALKPLQNLQFYVCSMEKSYDATKPQPKKSVLTYEFSNSTAESLHAMNEKISGKRSSDEPMEDESELVKRIKVQRKSLIKKK